MELIAKADVVLALGARLNPFSTLPGYGIDYWPKDAAIIHVDLNPDRIGLTKPVAVGIVGDAGDGAFGISMNEMTAIGRKEWPAITMVILRNYQWGAEKRNTTLWFDDNFVGTELNEGVSYAAIANACGLKGVQVQTMDDLTSALDGAIKAQAQGQTTFIEALINQELGEPFRRDAMKKPVAVAGISAADMRPQTGV